MESKLKGFCYICRNDWGTCAVNLGDTDFGVYETIALCPRCFEGLRYIYATHKRANDHSSASRRLNYTVEFIFENGVSETNRVCSRCSMLFDEILIRTDERHEEVTGKSHK